MHCHNKEICLLNSSSFVASLDKPFSDPIPPLVSNELKKYLEFVVNIVALTLASLVGTVTNIINIIVYWKQGLKESITLGFFALSIADLHLVIMSLLTASYYAAKAILPDSNIDFQSVHYVSSGSMRNMGYSFSVVLTAFLSIERCCCVVFPFKVKLIFTRSRTAIMLILILIIHVVCYVPFFATQELRWIPSMSLNNTVMNYKLRVYFTQNRKMIERFNYILFLIITPTVSQAIVIVCVIILLNGLRSSSKFRKAAAGGSQCRAQTASNIARKPEFKDKEDEGSGEKFNFREARLVKTMIALVLILSMSNIPFLAILYAQMLVPELNMGKAYHNMFTLSHSVVYVLSSINSSVNMFVYYSNSTRYRDIFNSLFRLKRLK